MPIVLAVINDPIEIDLTPDFVKASVLRNDQIGKEQKEAWPRVSASVDIPASAARVVCAFPAVNK